MEKYANCDQFLCHVDDCYLFYLNKKILGETFEPKGVFQSDEPFTLRGYKNFLGKPINQIISFFDIENMVKLIRIKMVNFFQFLFTVSALSPTSHETFSHCYYGIFYHLMHCSDYYCCRFLETLALLNTC